MQEDGFVGKAIAMILLIKLVAGIAETTKPLDQK